MLILFAGLLGVVALPFILLLLPVAIWLAIPTAVFFAGYVVKKSADSHGHWLVPPHRV
jgi:hypothetical protein